MEWRSAGTGLSSNRDSVEGSCVKHLTTEFYTVIYAAVTAILIIISIPSPLSFTPG